MVSDKRSEGRPLRGFAALSEEQRRKIASKGGRIAHERGNAHEWDSREASLAAARRRNRTPQTPSSYKTETSDDQSEGEAETASELDHDEEAQSQL